MNNKKFVGIGVMIGAAVVVMQSVVAQTQATPSSFDSVRAGIQPYSQWLAGSSYRVFFGRSMASGAALPALPPVQSSAVPTDHPDKLVNDPVGNGIMQSEVAIAERGGTIVAGWNDAEGFYSFLDGVTGWGVSFDGGKTFKDGGGLPRMASPGFFHSGDPDLAVSEGGTFFFSDLCFDFDASVSGICVTKGRPALGTIRWAKPVYAAAASLATDFLDKSFMAADAQGKHIYVSYTRFSPGAPLGQIEVAASHDGGVTFGAPVVVGPAIWGVVNQGSEPAVGPNGEIYVVWERGWQTSPNPEIVVSKSVDRGISFSAPVVIATINSMAFTPPSGYNRSAINDFPRIDVARTGPRSGQVYVTFHSLNAGDPDVYLSRSSNGLVWSSPVRVNDDPPGSLQFWPVVAVEPGGNLNVMWYDRRLNPGTSLTNTFWSQSTDGGATFRGNVRLSDVSTDWSLTASDAAPNFGDYNGISGGGDRSFGAWGDGRLGTPDVFFSELRGVGKAP